jgi:hypothetical protein
MNKRRSATSVFPFYRSLRIEPLEERRVLANLTVSSFDDNVTSDAVLTLREAVQVAN